jgi:hypothetical protein
MDAVMPHTGLEVAESTVDELAAPLLRASERRP